MPRFNVWIKNEDLDKWLAIADRPAWLHEQLKSVPLPGEKQIFQADVEVYRIKAIDNSDIKVITPIVGNSHD